MHCCGGPNVGKDAANTHTGGLCVYKMYARVVFDVGNNAIDAHAQIYSTHKLGSHGGANLGDNSMGKLGGLISTNTGREDTNTKTG